MNQLNLVRASVPVIFTVSLGCEFVDPGNQQGAVAHEDGGDGSFVDDRGC